MKAWIFADKQDEGGWVEMDPARLPELPVRVAVTYSALNYKDALSLTRRAPISRSFPMVPGIDLVGRVIDDESGTFSPGDEVVATGQALGEKHWGAFSQQARLKPEWLTRLPLGINGEQAAAFGTAGVTAAMCVQALESRGMSADKGPVLVTGVTGGVGGFAALLLIQAGYRVVAASGRKGADDYLTRLGISEIVPIEDLRGPPRPLASERWQAGIDVVGGEVLANILSSINYGGAVAACGLVGSMDLATSVAPFILRGVSLLGVDSVMAGAEVRKAAWQRLAALAPIVPFEIMVSRYGFSQARALADDLIEKRLKGRSVLDWALDERG